MKCGQRHEEHHDLAPLYFFSFLPGKHQERFALEASLRKCVVVWFLSTHEPGDDPRMEVMKVA